MFEYRGKILNVVDGDTIDVQFDLGFDTYRNERIRLLGIDTPEIRTQNAEIKKAGKAAKERVIELILNKEVIIRTQKDKTEKYGRYLGEIILDDGGSLNNLLIIEKLGVAYFGGKKGE